LKSVRKALASAPALCSLDVHNYRVFTTITNSFIAGVTRVWGMDFATTALRFHTLQVTKCPFVIPRRMSNLAGLRILYLADTCPLQIKFPAMGCFVYLVELTVNHNSY